ncbi:MAG: hypothetical protein ABEJ85_05070 [Haloarculaceae archaeon]
MVAIEQLDDDVGSARHEYDDVTVFAADFGPDRSATVDVVDGTAIVLADGEQYDIDLPGEDARAFMKNGVLTIEVEG